MHTADLFRTLDTSTLSPLAKQKSLVSFIEEIRRYYLTLNSYGIEQITLELKSLADSDLVSPDSRKLATLLSYLTTTYHYTINNTDHNDPQALPSGKTLLTKIFNTFYTTQLDNLVYAEQYTRKEAAAYLALSGVQNSLPIKLTND